MFSSVCFVCALMSPLLLASDPDRSVDDVDVAVGTAGVVDEARDVAADAGVDDGAVRQLEAPDVAASDVAPLAPEALLVRDLFSRVIDDPFVLRNGLGRINAPPVNLRPPFLDHVLMLAGPHPRSLSLAHARSLGPQALSAVLKIQCRALCAYSQLSHSLPRSCL